MNIINRVTWQHLKENKKRTMITMLGIAISVAMFVAVAITMSSFLDLFQRVEIEQSGKWHVAYVGVDGEKVAPILQDTRVESGYVTQVLDEETKKETAVAVPDCKKGTPYHVYLYLKDLDNLSAQAKDIKSILGVTDPDCMKYHSTLLAMTGETTDARFNDMMRSMAIILVFLIMLGSVSLIFNAFSISVSERSRYLGMMASVGATRGQKRQSVVFEAFILGGAGIPLGMIIGFGGMGITFAAITPLLQKIADTKETMNIVVNPEYLILAILCSVVTIAISALIPAHRATKITAIEAIRQSGDIKIRAKKVKTSKLTQRVFGFEGAIGLKNLKRNRKRYRITVFALAINIVLFLGVSGFSYYMNSGYEVEQRNYNADVIISGSNMKNQGVVDAFQKIDGVNDWCKEAYIGDVIYKMSDDECAKRLTSQAKSVSSGGDNAEDVEDGTLCIKGVDDKTYEAYSKQVGAISSNEKIQGILINRNKIRKGYSVTDVNMLTSKVGDKIPLIAETGYGEGETKKDTPIDGITLTAVTKECPMGTLCSENSAIYIIAPMSSMTELKNQSKVKNLEYTLYLRIDGKKNESIEKKLQEYRKKYEVSAFSLYTQAQQIRRTSTLANVFSYGFISLITLICIANILNTISTSIQLRRREMAMLRSIGMTPKGLDKMLLFESLFYGLKALIVGLPIGIGVMVLMYYSISGSIEMAFTLPLTNILVAAGSVFLVVGAAMRYSVRKIRKENLMDALKAE